MQSNDNFFISEELLNVFDQSLINDEIDEEVKAEKDIVYEINSDNVNYRCNIIKFKQLEDYNRITLITHFDILEKLFLKKDVSFIVRNNDDIIKKIDIDLKSKGLSIKLNKDNIYIIKLNLEKTSHGI